MSKRDVASSVLVIGAGNSGLGMVAHLASLGVDVRLWNRSNSRIQWALDSGGLTASGAITGVFFPSMVTSDLNSALEDCDLVIVTTPSIAHADVANAISASASTPKAVLLSPGRTMGAVVFKDALGPKKENISVAEAQTVIHTCRDMAGGCVHLFSIKPSVMIAGASPEEGREVNELLPQELRAHYRVVDSWLTTSLTNIGYVLHCAPMLLNTGWVESSNHTFNFYRNGISPRVASVLEKLDAERCKVADAYNVSTPTLCEWLHEMYGTPLSDLYSMLQKTNAYQFIDAPSDMAHRYIVEDVPCGLVPMESLGLYRGVATPVTTTIINLANLVLSENFRHSGRKYSVGVEEL